ncbi:metallophosphoesterase [Eubacteriaceae bacterium ES3]|nr:metallophosphoesterase [Eubacteriaceae bacterium ES3]
MKWTKHNLLLPLSLILIVTTSGCSNPSASAASLNLFENDSEHESSRIVVISDLHLGIDDSFSETVTNKAALVSFLEQLRSSEVDEIVIDGDLLDQWFVPANYESPDDLSIFFKNVADNNAQVIDEFKTLIKNDVKVTYVPGNHDLLLTEEILAELIPGIEQARDVDGLGTYRTGTRSEIVIEHGHRYNTFCAPDTLSNKEFTGDYPSILPPGYFFTRVAATSVVEEKSGAQKDLPQVTQPASDNIDQLGAYIYYQTWAGTIQGFPIVADFNDPVINVNLDGYNNNFSLSDLLPTQQTDGRISAVLYADVQSRWDALQELNNVAVKLPYAEATAKAQDSTYTDEQAVTQYFDIDSTVDVVIFGHTHVPVLNTFSEGYNSEKIYANTGTWIDENLLGDDMTFVVIESGQDTTDVRLMQYNASEQTASQLDSAS